MPETAKLTLKIDGKDQTFDLPVITRTENEKAIDISSLRGKTGHVCLDPAFVNTASTTSAITFLDGEKGVLRYRGTSRSSSSARRAPSSRRPTC